MRILWADDQQDVAKTLSLSLSDKNKHKITFVDNGNEVLRVLSDRVFDVAIIDLAMPPGAWGGLWVLEQLKDNGHKIPVLVLSGEGKQPETIRAIRLGARDFVTKERATVELQERLEALLEGLWNEIHREVLTSFPSPLALTYKRYTTSPTPQARMRSLIDIYEQALRLAGIVGLAEAGGYKITVPQHLVAQLNRPSIGSWQGVAQNLNKQLPPRACLPKMWRCLDEERVAEVIKTRNDIAHGYEFGDSRAESWLLQHQSALRAWLARLWQKLPFRLFSVLSSFYDGKTLSHTALALEGESVVLPKCEIKSKENLILHHSYLAINMEEPHIISIHPMLLTQRGEELSTWKIQIIDGWKSDRNTPMSGSEQLRYLELWSGMRTDGFGYTSGALPASIFSNHKVDE